MFGRQDGEIDGEPEWEAGEEPLERGREPVIGGRRDQQEAQNGADNGPAGTEDHDARKWSGRAFQSFPCRSG